MCESRKVNDEDDDGSVEEAVNGKERVIKRKEKERSSTAQHTWMMMMEQEWINTN
jgi:hypothetical protein